VAVPILSRTDSYGALSDGKTHSLLLSPPSTTTTTSSAVGQGVILIVAQEGMYAI
jgi:hypothetical protein